MRKPSFSTIVLWICIAVAVIGAGVGWQAMRYAEVASGYIARQMCACLYVQNRTEEDCKAELGSQIEQAQIVYFNERVVVNFLGLNRAQASLTPGYGCAVRDFEGSMPSGLDLTINEE